jgi:hypothetical protein
MKQQAARGIEIGNLEYVVGPSGASDARIASPVPLPIGIVIFISVMSIRK